MGRAFGESDLGKVTCLTVGRVECIQPNLDGPHTAIVDTGDVLVPFSSEQSPCFQQGDVVVVGRVVAYSGSAELWEGHFGDQHYVLCTNAQVGSSEDRPADVVRLSDDMPVGSRISARSVKESCSRQIPRAMPVFPNYRNYWISG